MAHTELDLRERRLIEDLLVAKASVASIAKRLSRHRSAVYREINRIRMPDLLAAVIDRLKAGWSPGQICDRLNATPRKCLGYRTPVEARRSLPINIVPSVSAICRKAPT